MKAPLSLHDLIQVRDSRRRREWEDIVFCPSEKPGKCQSGFLKCSVKQVGIHGRILILVLVGN